MLELRDYQRQLISDLYESMHRNKRIIVTLATGGGKTVFAAWLAEATQRKHKTIWFCVHRKELLDQTVATFAKFNIPLETIHIGMVSSFANHPDRYPEPDLIFMDEGQHSVAATWLKIINRFPDVFIVALTATPARLSGRPLGDIYTDIVIGADTHTLIESGYLAPYRYFSFRQADLAGLKKRGGDYSPEDTEKLMMDRAIYGDTIKHYKEIADGKQCVCFCTTIKHSQAVAESFREAGYNAIHFDGETPAAERAQIVADFRAGRITILTNVGLISEGFDLDAIDCVIQLRPTASLVLYLQSIGRCLRPKEGKTAIVIDQCGNYMRFGLPDDARCWSLTDTIREASPYDEAGKLSVRTCLQCYACYPSTLPACPICGEPYQSTRAEIKQIAAVRLVEIHRREADHLDQARLATQDRMRGAELKDCRTLWEVQAWCKTHGRTSGFGYAYAKRARLIK